MPLRTTKIPPDSSGLPLALYDLGTPGCAQYVIPTSEGVVSFNGFEAAFMTPGRAATAQPIFAIWNGNSSPLLVNVSELSFACDTGATIANTLIAPRIKLTRLSAVPTGGTALSKYSADAQQSSDANVLVFGDASADGTSSGAALAFTALGYFRAAFVSRWTTAPDGAVPTQLVALITPDAPILLRAGQGLGVSIIVAAGTSNPITNQYLVSAQHQEFILP